MIKNLEKNVKTIEEYLEYKKTQTIDIVDLVNYFAYKNGVKIKFNDKMSRIDNIVNPKQNIVFILVDGMGAYKVANLDDKSILKQNIKAAIQTVNPTSTACVLTTVATGKYPSEHGILGWWNYSKENNISYYPLLFLENKTGKSLEEKGYKMKNFFKYNSLFEKYNKDVNIYMKRTIIESNYSKYFSGKKAKRHGVYSIKDGFDKIIKNINEQSKASFNYFYISGLDDVSHKYGMGSYEALGIIKEVEEGIQKIARICNDTTVVVTADHGQINMSKHLYLNQNNDYTKYFYAAPSIDTRIISFFVKEECKNEFEEMFSNEFFEDIVLLTKDEFLKYGFIGDEYSKYALNSIGEYVGIVVTDKFLIADTVNLEDYMATKGNHSGITKEETTIPLIVI